MAAPNRTEVVTTLPQSSYIQNNWRVKHEAFLAAVRAARGSSSPGRGTTAPVVPSTVVNPDYVQCPYCERRFNEHSAERHIEFCKEQKSRITPKKDLTKLAKRTQYKPPLPGKKRSVNSGGVTTKKSQRQVLSPKYSNSSYVPSSFEKDIQSSAGPAERKNDLPRRESDIASSSPVVRRTQGSKTENSRKETVSRRHSHNSVSEGHKRSPMTENQNSVKREINGKKSLSKVDDKSDLFLDDDIGRAASGNRRNRSRPTESAAFKFDFDDQKKTRLNSKKLGPRLSNLTGGIHDSSGSGEDSDGCRLNNKSNSYGRKDTRHDSPSSSMSRTESGISVGSVREASGARLSKFCYECGTKYPVPHAKYCCECGVKRLYIDMR